MSLSRHACNVEMKVFDDWCINSAREIFVEIFMNNVYLEIGLSLVNLTGSWINSWIDGLKSHLIQTEHASLGRFNAEPSILMLKRERVIGRYNPRGVNYNDIPIEQRVAISR